jgi:hypothetical protein
VWALVAAFSCWWFGSITTLLRFWVFDSGLCWFARKSYGFTFLMLSAFQIVW